MKVSLNTMLIDVGVVGFFYCGFVGIGVEHYIESTREIRRNLFFKSN